MNSEDIQKILDDFNVSKIGKAKGPALAAISVRKLIYQYDFSGKLIKIYKSTMECSAAMKCGSRGIQSIIDGRDYVTGKPAYSKAGFIFRDKPTSFTQEELDLIKKNSNCAEGKPEFGQYDLQGNLIKKFKRTNLAAIEIYGKESVRKSIANRLTGEVKKPYKGYNWKYIDNEE